MMAMGQDDPSPLDALNSSKGIGGWAGFLIGPAFFLLAAWLVFGKDLSQVPIEESPGIRASDISTAPRRQIPVGESALVNINGFDRTCMDCHRIFPTRTGVPKRNRLQHRQILLSHGPNVRCVTCHDATDRDLLVLQDDSTAPLTATELLCASCHGRAYSDWKVGMHGRTNGYWDATRGKLVRLTCAECHDPHNPTFPARGRIKPLPGPRTLRMGEPAGHDGADHEEEEDPLRAPLGLATAEDPEGGR
ncbi:MAG: hypothetical protein V2A76_18255 [Planctomycetota bacterium]